MATPTLYLQTGKGGLKPITSFACPACRKEVRMSELTSGGAYLFRIEHDSANGYEPWHVPCLDKR